MKQAQIEKFVMRYLESQHCQIIEKSPAHVTVKLSPEADKDLTNRPYYWNFVERTSAEAETMTLTFIFDAEEMELQSAKQSEKKQSSPQAEPPASSPSILDRYFGFVPTMSARIPKDDVIFGSRRLEQIFKVVRSRGKYAYLFEHNIPPEDSFANSASSLPYSTWLGINYKVELACDMKRDEIHSLGLDLTNGILIEQFQEELLKKTMTPQFPSGIHLLPTNLTIPHAVTFLENHLERKIKQMDHRWADAAQLRYEDEVDRVDSYYSDLLNSVSEGEKEEIETQHHHRKNELTRQYKPRILISVINCGLFHFAANARFMN